MSAFLYIQGKRRLLEKIENADTLRVGSKSGPKDYEKALERWAKDGEINLSFDK